MYVRSMGTESPFLPLDALAERLGLPRKWLADEVRAGRIPFLVAGGRRLFDPEQVRAVLLGRAASQRPEGGSEK